MLSHISGEQLGRLIPLHTSSTTNTSKRKIFQSAPSVPQIRRTYFGGISKKKLMFVRHGVTGTWLAGKVQGVYPYEVLLRLV